MNGVIETGPMSREGKLKSFCTQVHVFCVRLFLQTTAELCIKKAKGIFRTQSCSYRRGASNDMHDELERSGQHFPSDQAHVMAQIGHLVYPSVCRKRQTQ